MTIFLFLFDITLIMNDPKGSHFKWLYVLKMYLNIKKNSIKPKLIRKCHIRILKNIEI